MLLYERFFRILSRAKTMLSNCDDNAFVLCVMAFMMMEASHLKQIDEAIDEEERTFKGVESAKKAENSAISPAIQQPKAQLNEYERLKNAIYERDFTLGECFEKNTAFISFEKNELKISSNADTNEARSALNKGFKLIMQLATQTLGEGVKIAVQKGIATNFIEANSHLNVDENKLQDIKKPKKDLKASFDELKSGARKQDSQAETINALGECFGEPEIQGN